MAEVDERQNEMRGRQEINVFTVMAAEQRSEFVDPSKRTFAAEAAVVDLGIEQPLASALKGLAIALVLSHMGNNGMVEADFASVTSIECAIGVEVGSGNRDAKSLNRLEGRL